MAFADAIGRMLDAQYATMGVAATWTPAGGAAISLMALRVGDDAVAPVHGLVGPLAVSPRQARVRVSEVEAAAPGVAPAAGDAFSTPDGDFLVIGAPIKRGARRLEWLFDLDAA